MNVVALSGSVVGSKTRTAIDEVVRTFEEKYPETNVQLIDLADYNIQFSDGRNYLEYEGDTGFVAKALMDADAIIIGSPIFQASIPGALKNIFDLLPVQAFTDKIAGIVMTAGSAKHYLVAEQQLKPILGYMKAQIVQSYVFAEEKDFLQKQIVNNDVSFRIKRLVEDTYVLAITYAKIREEQEDAYDF
ncbi:NADPH-dependent FMN reductase [Bacillus sp. JCM 19041]|uniref:NADPH-dependent FMN reductase n=1 Tax=Bacillus sp. JCM 19041 TaxID=1460637 RepID=UPI0006D1C58E